MIKKDTYYINNRRVRYNYFIENTFHAGIVLKGSEVKSIRNGKASIAEAYCYLSNGEIFLKNAIVAAQNNIMFSHNENRERKLLLTKKEIRQIQKAICLKGYTLMPISIEIPYAGFIKVNIAICKGKHNYDKRNTIKERDYQRYEK